MKEIHCSNCGRFLCKLAFGKLEIKCPKCKTINTVEVTSYTKMLNSIDEHGSIET
jgi:LSD1 subclass zinc finger protein